MDIENKKIEEKRITTEIERAAEMRMRTIVRFTNIDKESFTHSFNGISMTVGSGESIPLRLPEAEHLALHLARKILSRNVKKVTPSTTGVTLWNDNTVAELQAKMLTTLGNEGRENISPEEAHKRDLERLKKDFDTEPQGVSTSNVTENVIEDKKETINVTKKMIIDDLEKRGVKVDVSKTKEELLNQLMELEQQGITE